MPRDTSTERRPRLTRDAVIAGAVDLADRIGVAPLTLRKLADHLGVKPMAIYHHVANKDEILDGMVDAVFAEIELPSPTDEWRAATERRAASARAALTRHPWATGMLDSRTNPGPATMAHHDAVVAYLRANGFSLEMIAKTVAAVDAYVYGFALQAAALPGQTTDELADLADDLLPTFRAHYPELALFTEEYIMQPGYDFGEQFTFGLELILDGIEARLTSGR